LDLEHQPLLENLVDSMLATELVSTNFNDYKIDNLEAFSAKNEHAKLHHNTLIKQLIQHNIRMIEKYYE